MDEFITFAADYNFLRIMVTFTIALLLLLVGYWIYGRYINSLFVPDSSRKTPALTMTDGVDFIPLPTWKIFMIQFLNIAGLGPIFGAIMGAQSVRPLICGLCWERFLPVLYTISFPDVFPYVIMEKVCLKSSAGI